MSMPTNLPMSPQQAADAVNLSRRTIMRALISHELKAMRDNKNRWKINSSDLESWASCRHAPSDRMLTSNQFVDPGELASLKTEIRLLRERLRDVEGDRDAWRDMARNRGLRSFFGWLK